MQVKLTWEMFVEQFKPIKNNINPNVDAYGGHLFRPFGLEEEFVRTNARSMGRQLGRAAWTLVADDKKIWIAQGFRRENPLGYFITQVLWEKDDEYVVDEGVWNRG